MGRILRGSGRKVRYARHKPHISPAGRQKRVSWARNQRHISVEQWERRIFTDEIHIELSPCGMCILHICQATLTQVGQCPRVRRPPNTEYNERFIAPAFKGARTSVMFWGAVAFGYHSPLVAIRKRTPSERTHERDRLGLNSVQYYAEVLGPHLLPLLKRVSSSIASLEVIEDGAPCHTPKMTRQYRLEKGIRRMPWPAS